DEGDHGYGDYSAHSSTGRRVVFWAGNSKNGIERRPARLSPGLDVFSKARPSLHDGGDARPDMMQSCIAQQHIATTKGGETRGVRHAWCAGDRRSEAVVKGNQSKRGKKWRRAAAVVFSAIDLKGLTWGQSTGVEWRAAPRAAGTAGNRNAVHVMRGTSLRLRGSRAGRRGSAASGSGSGL
ncbi:hypothetical protein B0H12DRAFT_1080227, partial [Mycena haematopus]